jgi:L-ascorbate metabolism protein UlaG (beta-lactamase superfamily)
LFEKLILRGRSPRKINFSNHFSNSFLGNNAMNLTWFGSNTWLIELAGLRILLDPWLVGPLVFGNMPWFFKAVRPMEGPIPTQIDLILLSQGLPDHAHPPTLQALDRAIPVVGSPTAATVVQKLGYGNIQAIAPSESLSIGDRLEIRAFPGSFMGPGKVENAYILRDRTDGISLYYEPHGNHAPELAEYRRQEHPVDVVIVPLLELKLAFSPFIRGGAAAMALAKWLDPQVMIPTTIDDQVTYSGVLNALLHGGGSLVDFRQQLETDPDLQVKPLVLEMPTLGEPFAVPLKRGVSV